MLRLAINSPRCKQAQATLDVVIVHEDRGLLEGLRREFHRDRQRWNITITPDSREAAALLRKQRVDVMISGLPVHGGVDLLELAREASPGAARIRLAAATSPELVAAAAHAAHQVLPPTTDLAEMRATVVRLAASRDTLPEERLREIVGEVEVLPSPSDVQRRLAEVMQSEHTLADVAAVVESDVALAAELLKLVNSSFFGLPNRVEGMREALGLLGLELIEATVASRSAFADVADLPIDAAKINRHSQQVAAVAGYASAVGGVSRMDRGLAVSAGLLHDVGLLVLAQVEPVGSESAAAVLAVEDLDAERLAFGADRYAVGGHLLDLWGFSPRTPEAIRELHRPNAELGLGTVGWAVRLAHHAVTEYDIGLPDGPHDRDWFEELAEVERALLLER